MFAQISFQEKICSLLKREIAEQRLAPALLLSGGALTAKTEMALEIGRAYNCLDKAAADCVCQHCQQFQNLKFPGLQLLGGSDLAQRYRALLAANQAENLSKEQLRLLQQLHLRCSPILYNSSQDMKLLHATEAVAEFLLSPPSKVSKKNIKQLNSAVMNAEKFLLRPTPLAQLRNLQSWSQQSSSYKKVAIITRVESLSLAAVNALLKTLEEPAANFLIILTARLPNSLAATLLSRLRHYQLTALNLEQERQIIKQFYPQAGSLSLQEFFYGFNNEQLYKEAQQFLEGVEQQQPFMRLPLELQEQPLSNVVAAVSKVLSSHYPLEWRLFWAQETSSLYKKYHEYNINEKLLLRYLYQASLQFYKKRKGLHEYR